MVKIKYIEDTHGNVVFPVTHEKAVRDSNGTTLESKIAMQTQLINQAQMAVGAVPSDNTPTENSTNWVTSGGVYAVTSALDTVIYGVDENTIINNENASSLNWLTYTATGGSRGRFYLRLGDYSYNTYSITFSVASDSTIKVGSAIYNGNANKSSGYIYDTGWVSPGDSATYNSSVDANGNALYICLNTTYVSDTTSATTFEELLQYCTFQITFSTKVEGITSQIAELNSRKCLIASTNAKMVAHRGFHLNGIPENSIDAYRWAGFLGFDIAETDFCPTSDDELVLMHDASINRTMRNSDYTAISETVNVNSKTLSELRSGYVLISSDARYRRPIPTLEEYFIACRESNIFALPEIKSSGTTQAHVLAAYNLGMEIMGKGNFGFCSFSYSLLDYARSLSEDIPLWYIGNSILNTTNSITGSSRETPNTVWYPSYNGYSFSDSLAKQYKAKGMKVAVWTVPVSQFDDMTDIGVDYIAADTVSPNISRTEGKVYNETDFETNGTKSLGIQLAAGQYATIDGETIETGLYYLSIVASGSYTVTAANLSESITDSGYARHIYQGVIDSKSSSISITANDATDIQFINAKIIRIK